VGVGQDILQDIDISAGLLEDLPELLNGVQGLLSTDNINKLDTILDGAWDEARGQLEPRGLRPKGTESERNAFCFVILFC
jgi:hypothetical protein